MSKLTVKWSGKLFELLEEESLVQFDFNVSPDELKLLKEVKVTGLLDQLESLLVKAWKEGYQVSTNQHN